MAHDNDNNDHDGSKLTLPRFDPKDPTYFDDLQAYAQDRGLGWLLHAEGEDTNDISKYNDMTSEQFLNLKTSGEDATVALRLRLRLGVAAFGSASARSAAIHSATLA